MNIPGLVWLRPGWLLLLPVVLLAIYYLWKKSAQYKGWQAVIAPHLAKSLLKGSQRSSYSGLVLSILAATLTVLALSGPAVDRIDVPVMEAESGHVIVLDNSMQTRARDVTPDRHTQLKFKALDFIDLLNEGQTGLVIYAGNAFTVTPLTSDKSQLKHMLEPVTPELMTAAGNDPLLAMEEAHRLLQQAGYTQGHIFWFTAGITEQDMTELRQFFRGNNHRVSILASGSRDGAPVQTADGDLLRDQRGQIVVTRLYPEYLQRIARETQGIFVRYSAGQNDISTLADSLQFEQAEQRISEAFSADEWRDLGPYLALLLIPLILFAARKRVLLCFIPLLLILPPESYATEAESSLDSDGVVGKTFLNREQRAQQLYSQGHYRRAASVTQDTMRKGQSLYRAGDYEQAATVFESLNTAEAHYNRGNSLARAGQLEEAIQAYTKALAKRPDWQQAAENKDLVEQLKERQEEQSQGNDGESSEDQQPPQDSENSNSSENDGSEERNGQQDQHEQGLPEDAAEGDSNNQQQQDEPESSPADAAPRDSEQDQNGTDPEQSGTDRQNGPSDEALEQESVLQPLDRDLSDEEREEIEQLMRRLETDPAVLLRNRMILDSERRRTQSPPPRGGR